MIRFEPDTLRDALLRPFAMAAPDGGVYIEIMAPDFRFAVSLLAVAALLLFALWRRRAFARPPAAVGVLSIGMVAAFAAWLYTSGNGRYFIAFLLVAGPLCIALISLLPATRGFRFAAAALVTAIQVFAVHQSDPVRFWALSEWREPPYFALEIPDDLKRDPAVYVTLSSISYSIVAPQFPAASRWINIATAPRDRERTPEGRKVHEVLGSPLPLRLFAPAVTEYNHGGTMDAEMVRALNLMLGEHKLALDTSGSCRFLRSPGLGLTPAFASLPPEQQHPDRAGFWVCPLRYPVEPPPREAAPPARFDAVFGKLEAMCPRFFRRNEARTKPIPGAEMRHYVESDMKVYVSDEGEVYYKYMRAISPQLVGTVDEVLAGRATVDCTRIRGRSGLPWEREI